MLKHRIIPVVLINGYSVLKTIQFSERRNLGNPIVVAKTYNTRDVDELILLDIDASKQNRSIDLFTIQEIAKECFMPLTIGGGLKTIEDIRSVLERGADKVSINSEALKNPLFIQQASQVYGAQCIVVSIDVIKDNENYRIFSHSENEINVGLIEWCKKIEELGAGEILLNSVDRDGMMQGCDLQLVKFVSESVNIPVIACGGVSSTADCASLVVSGASAAAAASIFHFTSITPTECRNKLKSEGISAR